MIGLGLASSHAPAMFRPKEVWEAIYAHRANVPQPKEAALETLDVIEGYVGRIEHGFATLRAEIARYRPDALIMVGDDQGDLFTPRSMPAFCIFRGEEMWGTRAIGYLKEPPEDQVIRLPGHQRVADHILKQLMKRGFDPMFMSEIKGVGRPEHGISHMVTYPAPRLMPKLDIPVIPVFINEYYPPLPTARRCWDLGRALAEILADRPERVAIYASGGLSHDPDGPRSGWIDEPLDRWVLQRIERGEGEQLTNLFTFDSDTLRSGTGEIRAWIAVAGAMNRPATVIDYIKAHHAKTGLAFAYWPALEGNTGAKGG
jgi:aromatic ring-opening dioxygenase catalytic subunit (LigB family)